MGQLYVITLVGKMCCSADAYEVTTIQVDVKVIDEKSSGGAMFWLLLLIFAFQVKRFALK